VAYRTEAKNKLSMSTTRSGTSMPAAGLVPAERADDPADLVARNGRIYTGDPR
jgi:hypothetical protein